MSFNEQILAASAKHPKPERTFQYGTAGFRMKADLLDSVMFRTGLVASLRSRKLNGQTVGIMITASHNPPVDNGVKLVDPMGEMLETSWETYATELANAGNEQELVDVYNRLTTDLKIKPSAPSSVVFARDTRPSGPALVESLVDALKAVDSKYQDFGIFTTPQLHYVTRCLNTQESRFNYGEPTEEGYYKKLSEAFKLAMKHKKTTTPVTVDCANGVGAQALHKIVKYLPSAAEGGVDIKIVNDDVSNPETLNTQVGADFVKVQQRAPARPKINQNERWCSLDGDADRLVYYFVDETDTFQLLDGDRIATLAAAFIGDLARQAGLSESLKIGIVQTAYANGASTEYVAKSLKLETICTNTGVKHLHHAAQRFDIGVYFEANGHGTIIFSAAAQRAISHTEPKSPAQMSAIETLGALNNLINQTVGDAISDMLLVEVILAHKSWTLKEWLSTYTDLPSRLRKVEVSDRNVFVAVDAERRLESPPGVQEQIDTLVGKYKQGRSFARASGTEDAVRVYAEASTRGEADDLAQKVAGIVAAAGAP